MVHSRSGNYSTQSGGKVKVALEVQATGHQRAQRGPKGRAGVGYAGDPDRAAKQAELKAELERQSGTFVARASELIEWRLDDRGTAYDAWGKSPDGSFVRLADATPIDDKIYKAENGTWKADTDNTQEFATQEECPSSPPMRGLGWR